MVYLDAEFTRPKKSTRLIFRVGTIIPTSVKCIHSATKFKSSRASGFVKAFRKGFRVVPQRFRYRDPLKTLFFNSRAPKSRNFLG